MVRLSADRKFEFGKYAGLSFDEVMSKDLQYVEYINSKITWLFTDGEKQKMRNLRNKMSNRDVKTFNVKSRTPFEEEMYKLLNQIK